MLEHSAVFPWSWHDHIKLPPGQSGVSDAKSMIAFVDGHAAYIKIYWDPVLRMTAACYDPPAKYEYKWSGN